MLSLYHMSLLQNSLMIGDFHANVRRRERKKAWGNINWDLRKCCLNVVLWFVLMQLTGNFNVRSFGRVWKLEAVLSRTPLLYKWCFGRKGFSKQDNSLRVWVLRYGPRKPLCCWVNSPCPPQSYCLPCLCQIQTCWSTYSQVPWQGLFHHPNPERVFDPNSTSMTHHSLKI